MEYEQITFQVKEQNDMTETEYEQITFGEILVVSKMINDLIKTIVKVVNNNANPNRDSEPLEDIRIKGSK